MDGDVGKMADNKQVNFDFVLKTTNDKSLPSSKFSGAVNNSAEGKKRKTFVEKVMKGKSITEIGNDISKIIRVTAGSVLLNMIRAIPSVISTLVQGLGAVVVGVLGAIGISSSLLKGLGLGGEEGIEDEPDTITSESGTVEPTIDEPTDIFTGELPVSIANIGETGGVGGESSGIETGTPSIAGEEGTGDFETDVSKEVEQSTQTIISDAIGNVEQASDDLMLENKNFNNSLTEDGNPSLNMESTFDDSAIKKGQISIEELDFAAPTRKYMEDLPGLLGKEVTEFEKLTGDDGAYPKMESQLKTIVALLTQVMNPDSLVDGVKSKIDFSDYDIEVPKGNWYNDPNRGRIGNAPNTFQTEIVEV